MSFSIWHRLQGESHKQNIKRHEKLVTVLAKIVAFESDGKHKLTDKWEEDVYQVLLKLNIEIPVYIEQEDKTGRKRTLHWNLLLQQEDKTGRKRMSHWTTFCYL